MLDSSFLCYIYLHYPSTPCHPKFNGLMGMFLLWKRGEGDEGWRGEGRHTMRHSIKSEAPKKMVKNTWQNDEHKKFETNEYLQSLFSILLEHFRAIVDWTS